MNEELQTKLMDYLTRLEGGLDFTVEQAPLVVQEYLRWGLVESSLCCVLCILSLAVTLQLMRTAKKSWDDEEGQVIINCLGWGTILIVELPIFLMNFSTLLKITIAPKVYILEALRGLL